MELEVLRDGDLHYITGFWTKGYVNKQEFIDKIHLEVDVVGIEPSDILFGYGSFLDDPDYIGDLEYYIQFSPDKRYDDSFEVTYIMYDR